MIQHVRLVALAIAFLAAVPATAAEIKVLAYNAINIPARELAAAFTKETGHAVAFTFGSIRFAVASIVALSLIA